MNKLAALYNQQMQKLTILFVLVAFISSCKKDPEPHQGVEPLNFGFSFTNAGGNDLYFTENPTYHFNQVEITKNIDGKGEVVVDSTELISVVEGETEMLIHGDLDHPNNFHWEYHFKYSDTDIDTLVLKSLDIDSKNNDASYYFQVRYNGKNLCMPCDRDFHYDIVK